MNMAADTPGPGDFIAPRTLALGLAVAIMSFAAVIALLAWSPDLGKRDRAGAHPYSVSAIGYGGLVRLLEARETPVSVSRVSRNISAWGNRLLVLTPGEFRQQVDEDAYIAGPALLILPKWIGETDRARPEWQSNTLLRTEGSVTLAALRYDEEATAVRINASARIRTPYGSFSPSFGEKLQLLQSDVLEPVISAPTGHLLMKVPDDDIYILSDPDLANTFGLASPDNARLMLALLDDLRGTPDTPVMFDATLNGFERSTSLLKLALDVPFIGATLAALAAMALTGWASLVRFGAPAREERAIALGKQALADNTAGLFAMTRREARMAPGYLALTRKAAQRDLGVPKGLPEAEIAALFDRLTKDEPGAPSWSRLADDLRRPAASRDDLLGKAKRIYRWRKERTHGT